MSTYPMKYLYEILVRGAPDGTIKGAHTVYATAYAEGDERTGSAEPLEPSKVAAILGANFAGLAAQAAAAKERIAELEAELAARPRPVRIAENVSSIGWMSFMALFTPEEQKAVAVSADASVAVFRLMASGAGEVRLDDPLTDRGLEALIAAGCLAGGRKAQILAGQAPAIEA